VQQRINALLAVKGGRGIREIHRELGRIMWDDVGMARTEESLTRALARIPKLREEFWHSVSVPGSPDNLNPSLEYAGRVADYLEFAELLALDALERGRGGPRGEPDTRFILRETNYSYVAAQIPGVGSARRCTIRKTGVGRGASIAAELQVIGFRLRASGLAWWLGPVAAGPHPNDALSLEPRA
jgi:hypothetical protein